MSYIYEIGLDRVSLNLNIYRVSELNALGFPVLGVYTSLFSLHDPFYFSCKHLRVLSPYPLLILTFCYRRSRFFFVHAKPNSPVSSRILQDYFLRECAGRAGWETANVESHLPVIPYTQFSIYISHRK